MYVQDTRRTSVGAFWCYTPADSFVVERLLLHTYILHSLAILYTRCTTVLLLCRSIYHTPYVAQPTNSRGAGQVKDGKLCGERCFPAARWSVRLLIYSFLLVEWSTARDVAITTLETAERSESTALSSLRNSKTPQGRVRLTPTDCVQEG